MLFGWHLKCWKLYCFQHFKPILLFKHCQHFIFDVNLSDMIKIAASTPKNAGGWTFQHLRWHFEDWKIELWSWMYWAVQKDLVKGCRETLDCYCVSCELLSASIADTLLFVNILVSGIFHGRFAQRLAVNKPCLQIVRRLLWKQTTTHSIRNNNPMFDQQPLTFFFCPSQ